MTQTDIHKRAELAEEVLYDKWFDPQHDNHEGVSYTCAFCHDAEEREIDGSMCHQCLVPKDLCNYAVFRNADGLLGLHSEMWVENSQEDHSNLQVRDLPIWTFQYIRDRLKQMIAAGTKSEGGIK